MPARPFERHEVEALYAECSSALDDAEFDRWPNCFAEKCTYRITTKENLDRGWLISLVLCESRGMLLDRVTAVKKTLFIVPRMQRRMLSCLRLLDVKDDRLHATASFAIFETYEGEQTKLFLTGRFVDEIVREGDALKFAKRTCVLDSSIIPNSMPFPI